VMIKAQLAGLAPLLSKSAPRLERYPLYDYDVLGKVDTILEVFPRIVPTSCSFRIGARRIGILLGVVALTGGAMLAAKYYFQRAKRLRAKELARRLLDSPEELPLESEVLVDGTVQGEKLLSHVRRARRAYIATVIAQVKNTMGTPTRNGSNEMVARKMARTLMEKHNLRPTHIAAALPLVIEAVFVESTQERAARNWGEIARRRFEGWFGWDWRPAEPDF